MKRLMVTVTADTWDDRAMTKASAKSFRIDGADYLDMADLMVRLSQTIEEYRKEKGL